MYPGDGQVYGWGGNSYSQVGLASSSSVQVPTLIGGALSGKTVTKIACGGNHSLALISTGEASVDYFPHDISPITQVYITRTNMRQLVLLFLPAVCRIFFKLLHMKKC